LATEFEGGSCDQKEGQIANGSQNAKNNSNTSSDPNSNNITINMSTTGTSAPSFIVSASELLAADTVQAGKGNAAHISSATDVSGATVSVLQDGNL